MTVRHDVPPVAVNTDEQHPAVVPRQQTEDVRSGSVEWPERTANTMLWTIILILLVLWALGLIGSIGGAAVHLLLVLAIVVIAVQLLGRRSAT
jgi:hypothetical protein